MRDKNATKMFVAMVVIVGGLWAGTGLIWSSESKQKESPVVASASQAAIQGDSTLVVEYSGVTGKSALELLKTATVITTTGSRIDSINGIKNGTGGKHWIVYINGHRVSSPNSSTQNGDTIQWKFE